MAARGGKRVARIWRGRTRAEDAERYRAYLYREGVLQLRACGALEVKMLRRVADGVAHFVVVSYWDSMEAMKAWSGAETGKTRFLEEDAALLLDLADDLELLEVCHAEPD